ncbi:MAG: hypothetical protein GEU79_17570 [Acidimicrobiia bacterium]|nr:hypothetical protein [Acidimicrobiia bacterium]
MNESSVEALIAAVDPDMRAIVEPLRDLVRSLVSDPIEEPDPSAKLIGYTYQPGTYKGLIVAIAPHASHVNLMFSKGVEMLDVDTAGLIGGRR